MGAVPKVRHLMAESSTRFCAAFLFT